MNEKIEAKKKEFEELEGKHKSLKSKLNYFRYVVFILIIYLGAQLPRDDLPAAPDEVFYIISCNCKKVC